MTTSSAFITGPAAATATTRKTTTQQKIFGVHCKISGSSSSSLFSNFFSDEVDDDDDNDVDGEEEPSTEEGVSTEETVAEVEVESTVVEDEETIAEIVGDLEEEDSVAEEEDEIVAEEMEMEEEEDEDSEEWEKNERIMRNFLAKIEEAKRQIDNIDEETFVANMTPEDIAIIEGDEIDREVDDRAAPFLLTEQELDELESKSPEDEEDDDTENEPLVPDVGDPIYGGPDENSTAIREDLIELSKSYDELVEVTQQHEESQQDPSTRIHNIESIDDEHIMRNVLDEATRNEILNLDDEVELDEDGEPNEIELHKQRRQLIYDLDFNVTNIFLASFKVNADAPVVLEHWMYELRNWTRYENVRLREFNFTWGDVDNADTEELDRYWQGAGTKGGTPKPTIQENPNVVEWDEGPLDYEEEYMLALESWMDEVYHEEDDVNLDDEDLMPSDNPAAPEHGVTNENDGEDPVLSDVAEFEERYEHMSPEWRETYVKREQYDTVNQEDSDFRGHLVIACSPADDDLDMAEKLTLRMEKEFGEQVFVETRVVGHAKPEDYLYEIWLESWEVELLHSKRRAVFQKDWEGPRDISEDYIDDLVKQVDFYISDEFRYAFSW